MFDFNDNRLELVKDYKHLGLTVTCNGKRNYAAEILVQKARKAFFGLKANIPSSDSLSVQQWLKLYNSMITPILTYGSEIWIADHKINIENLHNLSFEKTQNMIMKQILGVHAELGLETLCFKALNLIHLEIQSLKIFNLPQVTGKKFQMIIIILILSNYYASKMIIKIMILLSN